MNRVLKKQINICCSRKDPEQHRTCYTTPNTTNRE